MWNLQFTIVEPSMHLLGLFLVGDRTGAASAIGEAGVSAEAELKSYVG